MNNPEQQTPAASEPVTTAPDYIGSATYSPEDNKLRLYPFARLPRDIYERVRACGFIWAPKQELFVAPMWTPSREDLLVELCGDVGDEDKSLVDRAEERSERFETYSERRAGDAESARQGVAAIADNIPLGQPILVGHHSERRARKDAERIENGMRKAVKMWETSKYWEERARGALRAAKYKELPTVRARRIKTIEADKRKRERELNEAVTAQTFWLRPDLTHEEALRFAGGANRSGFHMPRKEGDRPDFNQDPSEYNALSGSYPNLYAPRTLAEVVARAAEVYPARVEYLTRWIGHFENRLAYEKAMLDEQGAGHLIAPKERPKQLPLLNYRTKSVSARHWGQLQTFPQVEMTSEDYQRIYSEQRGTLTVNGTHRVRFGFVELRDGKPARFADHGKGVWSAVFLTDSKEHPVPSADGAPAPAPKQIRIRERVPGVDCVAMPPREEKPDAAKFEALKESLKAGVKVVSAPQLFPTPPTLARRMVELADIGATHSVLEPSAGMGNIAAVIRERFAELAVQTGVNLATLTCVEISTSLADRLQRFGYNVRNADFLQCNGELGEFDRVVMNPPFANGVDVIHVRHALNKLKVGGKLVAVVAGGPRQKACLEPLADYWEELPDGTFAEQGTNVRTVLLVIEKRE